MTDDSTTSFIPPYIAFKTIVTLVERMVKEEPPNRIDKSYLDNFSGGYQTQVMAALSSLGLVGEGGELSDTLKDLVAADDAGRKRIVADLITTHYGTVLELGLNATQQELLEAFTLLAPTVTGDTKRKAIAFFLGACAFAGVQVSKHWKTPRVPAAKTTRKAKDQQVDGADGDDGGAGEIDESLAPKANLKDLQLVSGGRITLGITVDLFELSASDREFVFKLVDAMTGYERSVAAPDRHDDDDDGDDGDDL